MSFIGEYNPRLIFQPHVDEDARLNEFREARMFPVLRSLASAKVESQKDLSRSSLSAPHLNALTTVPSVRTVITKQRMKKNPSLSSIASKMRLDGVDSSQINRRRQRANQHILEMKQLQASCYEDLNPMPGIQKTLIEERMNSKRAMAAKFSLALKNLPGPAPLSARLKLKQADEQQLSFEEIQKRALDKLALKAKHWDHGFISLEGFQGREMTPEQFKAQLETALLLHLTPAETEAVVVYFDDNANGRIDGAEFLNHFFRLGREMRRKDIMHNWQVVADSVARQKEMIREKERQWKEDNKNAVAPYTREEQESVVRKIAAIAEVYNRHAEMDRATLKPFYNVKLQPVTMRDQLLVSFALKVTKSELAALMDQFDKDKSGSVDGGEFLKMFFTLGNRAQLQRAKELEESNMKRKEKLLKKALPKVEHLGR